MIGLIPSSFTGPCHISRRASKFTSDLVRDSLGGEVYVLSEMADRMFLWRDFYTPFGGLTPGIVGPGNCEFARPPRGEEEDRRNVFGASLF